MVRSYINLGTDILPISLALYHNPTALVFNSLSGQPGQPVLLLAFALLRVHKWEKQKTAGPSLTSISTRASHISIRHQSNYTQPRPTKKLGIKHRRLQK